MNSTSNETKQYEILYDMKRDLSIFFKPLFCTSFRKSTLIVLLCIGLSHFSFSQENDDLATYPGKWVYTNNNLSNEWFGERFYKMNPAELQKYHSTTEKLVSYLHRQPVAQRPVGITLNAQSRAAYNHYDHELHPVKPDERVKAEVYLPFCSLIHRNDKVDYACDEVSYIKMRTNDEFQTFESAHRVSILYDKQAMKQFKEIFYLPRKLHDLGSGVYLYDWYYENRIVVARNDRPLWIPITNREYIKRLMAYSRASLAEGETPQMVIDALESEIASIPPEIMSMPAYVNGNMERPLTEICTMEEDSTWALYIFNPDYFDPTLPRTQVQLITISIEGHADSEDWIGINAHRVWEFIHGLKGEDLRKLLDVN